MVCAEHKDVAKAKIKKYREARRATKLGAKTSRSAPAGARKNRFPSLVSLGRARATP
jgi:hypothetical protein